MKPLTEKIHIDKVKIGDTVLLNGELKTVGKESIKRGGFCGTTLFGDSFQLGTIPIERVVLNSSGCFVYQSNVCI